MIVLGRAIFLWHKLCGNRKENDWLVKLKKEKNELQVIEKCGTQRSPKKKHQLQLTI